MEKKLLSICIPTWNRKEKLGKLLRSIEENIPGMEGGVEVCISDNGSTDGTVEYIKNRAKEFRFENRLFPGEKNEGFDRNVLRVLMMGSGEWLWIIGDDDRIADGGLKKVYGFLEGLPEEAAVAYGPGRGGGGRGDGMLMHGAETLVERPGGFISSILVRKSALCSLERKKMEAGIGTFYMHCWLLRLIGIRNPECKVAEFRKPIIIPERSLRGEKGGVPGGSGTFGTTLSRELWYAGALIYQYSQFIWQNIAEKELWVKYLPFATRKLLGSAFFPVFEMMCEKEFREKTALERIPAGFFLKTFGPMGPAYFVFRSAISAMPRRANGFLFRRVLWCNEKLKITRESRYSFWKEFWGCIPNPAESHGAGPRNSLK
jgi:glycosyltransferase involved in cell wall biosynthesis